MALALNHPAEGRQGMSLRWPAVALVAAALAYVDGFWLAALQGAIGAIERLEMPFNRWLRDSTLMVPLFALAVLAALALGRRLAGSRRAPLTRLRALALLLALLASAVAIGEAAVSSTLDYRHQITHTGESHGNPEVAQEASTPAFALYCNLRGSDTKNLVMQLEYTNLRTHLRALSVFSPLILVTNLVLAAGLVALLRRRLGGVERG